MLLIYMYVDKSVYLLFSTYTQLAEKALAETKTSLEKVREEMQAWKTQYDSTRRKLITEQAAYSSLKVCVFNLVYSSPLPFIKVGSSLHVCKYHFHIQHQSLVYSCEVVSKLTMRLSLFVTFMLFVIDLYLHNR